MKDQTFTPTQACLNEALAHLFSKSECWGGYLHMQPTPSEVLFGARGYHLSGQEINVYPIEPPLQALLRQYADESPGGIGFLTIQVNLRQSIFRYRHTTVAEEAQTEAAETAAQSQRDQQHRARLFQELSPAPFGPALAAQVAATLAQGHELAYGHPAHCGTGLNFYAGHYRYGMVWEGTLEPHQTWATRPEFEAWLAQQSDLSLALLELPQPKLWHNQTVTRARLLELVGEQEKQ
jgi:hypothetical protein